MCCCLRTYFKMQMATSIEKDNGEMIVKRVSVPVGLEELMEGLTKEILLKKPKDIYVFASQYFANLLNLREKGSFKVASGKRAQSVTKQIPAKNYGRNLKTKSNSVDTFQLTKQISIRSDSPSHKTLTTKKINLGVKTEKNEEKAKSFLNKRKLRKHSKDNSATSTSGTKPPNKQDEKIEKKTPPGREKFTGSSEEKSVKTPCKPSQPKRENTSTTKKSESKNKETVTNVTNESKGTVADDNPVDENVEFINNFTPENTDKEGDVCTGCIMTIDKAIDMINNKSAISAVDLHVNTLQVEEFNVSGDHTNEVPKDNNNNKKDIVHFSDETHSRNNLEEIIPEEHFQKVLDPEKDSKSANADDVDTNHEKSENSSGVDNPKVNENSNIIIEANKEETFEEKEPSEKSDAEVLRETEKTTQNQNEIKTNTTATNNGNEHKPTSNKHGDESVTFKKDNIDVEEDKLDKNKKEVNLFDSVVESVLQNDETTKNNKIDKVEKTISTENNNSHKSDDKDIDTITTVKNLENHENYMDNVEKYGQGKTDSADYNHNEVMNSEQLEAKGAKMIVANNVVSEAKVKTKSDELNSIENVEDTNNINSQENVGDITNRDQEVKTAEHNYEEKDKTNEETLKANDVTKLIDKNSSDKDTEKESQDGTKTKSYEVQSDKIKVSGDLNKSQNDNIDNIGKKESTTTTQDGEMDLSSNKKSVDVVDAVAKHGVEEKISIKTILPTGSATAVRKSQRDKESSVTKDKFRETEEDVKIQPQMDNMSKITKSFSQNGQKTKDNKDVKRSKSVDVIESNQLKKTKSTIKNSANKVQEQKQEQTKEHLETAANKREVRRKRAVSVETTKNKEFDKIARQTSFDSSKLREELKQANEISKTTSFKASYNPFKLKQEIKQAAEVSKGEKRNEFELVAKDIVAAIKIQSLWRGFLVRRHNNKINESTVNDAMITNETDKSEIGENKAVLSIKKEELQVTNLEKQLANSKETECRDNKTNFEDNAAVKVQSLWRGYSIRKNNKKIKQIRKDNTEASDKEKNNVEVNTVKGEANKPHLGTEVIEKHSGENALLQENVVKIEHTLTEKTPTPITNQEKKFHQKLEDKGKHQLGKDNIKEQKNEELREEVITDKENINTIHEASKKPTNEEMFVTLESKIIPGESTYFEPEKNEKDEDFEAKDEVIWKEKEKPEFEKNALFAEKDCNNARKIDNDGNKVDDTTKRRKDVIGKPDSENLTHFIDNEDQESKNTQEDGGGAYELKGTEGFSKEEGVINEKNTERDENVSNDAKNTKETEEKQISLKNEEKEKRETHHYLESEKDNFENRQIIQNVLKLANSDNKDKTQQNKETKTKSVENQLKKIEDNELEKNSEDTTHKVIPSNEVNITEGNIKNKQEPISKTELVHSEYRDPEQIDGKEAKKSKEEHLEKQEITKPENEKLKEEIYYEKKNHEHEVDDVRQIQAMVRAILKIQAVWRGFKTRKQFQEDKIFGRHVKAEAKNKEELEAKVMDKSKAVSKIQALWRGYKVRKAIKEVTNKLEEQQPAECDELSWQGRVSEEDIFNAACKIQAGIRGYMVRKGKNNNNKLKSITEETTCEDRHQLSDDSKIANQISDISKKEHLDLLVMETSCSKDKKASDVLNIEQVPNETKDIVIETKSATSENDNKNFKEAKITQHELDLSTVELNSSPTNKLSSANSTAIIDDSISDSLINKSEVGPVSREESGYENAPTRPVTSSSLENVINDQEKPEENKQNIEIQRSNDTVVKPIISHVTQNLPDDTLPKTKGKNNKIVNFNKNSEKVNNDNEVVDESKLSTNKNLTPKEDINPLSYEGPKNANETDIENASDSEFNTEIRKINKLSLENEIKNFNRHIQEMAAKNYDELMNSYSENKKLSDLKIESDNKVALDKHKIDEAANNKLNKSQLKNEIENFNKLQQSHITSGANTDSSNVLDNTEDKKEITRIHIPLRELSDIKEEEVDIKSSIDLSKNLNNTIITPNENAEQKVDQNNKNQILDGKEKINYKETIEERTKSVKEDDQRIEHLNHVELKLEKEKPEDDVIPEPQKQNSADVDYKKPINETQSKEKTQRSTDVAINLMHSSEFHDTITVPISVHPPLKTSSGEDEKQSNNRQASPQGLVNTGELHDSVPLSVQLNDAPPAGAEVLTSHVPKSINDGDGGQNSAQASGKDASACKTQPDKTTSSPDSMETEKRNNASLQKKSMEAEAATKIQAGFRGYQVRKQLKNKYNSEIFKDTSAVSASSNNLTKSSILG